MKAGSPSQASKVMPVLCRSDGSSGTSLSSSAASALGSLTFTSPFMIMTLGNCPPFSPASRSLQAQEKLTMSSVALSPFPHVSSPRLGRRLFRLAPHRCSARSMEPPFGVRDNPLLTYALSSVVICRLPRPPLLALLWAPFPRIVTSSSRCHLSLGRILSHFTWSARAQQKTRRTYSRLQLQR